MTELGSGFRLKVSHAKINQVTKAGQVRLSSFPFGLPERPEHDGESGEDFLLWFSDKAQSISEILEQHPISLCP